MPLSYRLLAGRQPLNVRSVWLEEELHTVSGVCIPEHNAPKRRKLFLSLGRELGECWKTDVTFSSSFGSTRRSDVDLDVFICRLRFGPFIPRNIRPSSYVSAAELDTVTHQVAKL